jgi:hypothetical protein
MVLNILDAILGESCWLVNGYDLSALFVSTLKVTISSLILGLIISIAIVAISSISTLHFVIKL